MLTMEERTSRNFDANLGEMGERIARLMDHDGWIDPLPGIRVTRFTKPVQEVYADSKPAFCVVAQGAKEISIGGATYRYDTHHYLLATVEMPVTNIMLAPSPSEPFLALRVELDPGLVGSVMVEAGIVAPATHDETKALGVSRLEPELLEAAVRVMRLLDRPKDQRVLLPLLQREIVYRLLTGDQGHRLRHLPAPSGHTSRIAKALERLRAEFDQPLRIESLARDMGMSSTRFHHHFKSVTDMSPLQFQKSLRLQEARRLMLSDELDAASAGYKVGYEDASHFSRDYKKHFGESPMRDVERLRAAVLAN
ncbi:AraC family transcriptional regulator [bacterium]|nr:MAG: AraC family transcriptional regulator [bacterium]